MLKQVYYSDRNVVVENGLYELIKQEMLPIYLANKALLNAKLDAAETYSFDANGFKILDEICEPIRLIECNHLIIKNDVVVGSVILRVNNNRPTHGRGFLMDCMVRTYELRFKTFAGCDFTVEGTGIAISQNGETGPLKFNTGCGTGFAESLLKRHWDEFKSDCTFTAGEIDTPNRLRKWTKLNVLYSGQSQ